MMQAELIETGNLARSIEAVLFVASESLSIKALARLTGAEEADVSIALQRIDADFAQRGIVLREIAGGYRFASSPAARSAVEAYLMPPKTNLSPAALETLAIVAYMQPVTKGDIEGIRGVSADSVLSTLVDRRFLAEAGRKDVAGRPILYKTTGDFLEAFGLRSLEELPPIDIDASSPPELVLPIGTRPFHDPGTEEHLAAQSESATDAVAEAGSATEAIDEPESATGTVAEVGSVNEAIAEAPSATDAVAEAGSLTDAVAEVESAIDAVAGARSAAGTVAEVETVVDAGADGGSTSAVAQAATGAAAGAESATGAGDEDKRSDSADDGP